MTLRKIKTLTHPHEFKKFTYLLLSNAPKNYVPWFFRCAKESKEPALQFGSWKNEKNRLNYREAYNWLLQGGNIGIAGTDKDTLVNLDADGGIINTAELKPTLTSRTRSRTGLHCFYFTHDKKRIGNIPTDNAGEVRSNWQYVLTPGSYVKTDPNEVPKKYRDDNIGVYTIEVARPVAWITYEELPKIFRETKEKSMTIEPRKPRIFTPKMAKGKHSALFDLTAHDIVLGEGGETQPSKRWSSILHGSTTQHNMSLSRKGLLHCWRHNVSLNALQTLTVLSGYMTCQEAGSPHKTGGAPPSMVTSDDGAIFHAWKWAKENRYIPEDDKIPTRAMNYIARKHGLYDPQEGKLLPKWVYNKVLEIVEDEY